MWVGVGVGREVQHDLVIVQLISLQTLVVRLLLSLSYLWKYKATGLLTALVLRESSTL